jgi:aldose 1-epimerase
MTAEQLGPEPGRRETVELRSPSGELEASFVPQAGMIGWSLRHRGDELVGHPHSLEVYVQGGHATAIPLLHPWANRLASDEYEIAGQRVRLDLSAHNVHIDSNGLPIHGLVAGSPDWEVVEHTHARLKTSLDFASHPELMAGFPFPHRLELTIEMYEGRIGIDTELIPTGDVPVPVAFGFHPFLRLPGLPREQWLVELPVTKLMPLDDRRLPTGVSEPIRIPPGPLGKRIFDDAFDGLADPSEFVISGAGRRVSLRFVAGYRFAQIYAPEGSEFICFEPMTAPINPFESKRTLIVQPSSRYLARFEITVSG